MVVIFCVAIFCDCDLFFFDYVRIYTFTHTRTHTRTPRLTPTYTPPLTYFAERVRVLFEYEKQSEEELSLFFGDIIAVTNKSGCVYFIFIFILKHAHARVHAHTHTYT